MHDAEVRKLGLDPYALVSFATGNPKLTAYSGDKLTYTFGRLAGLAGSVDSYDPASFSYATYAIPRSPGNEYDFGFGNNTPPYNGALSEVGSTTGYFGVWAGSGTGKSYRPWYTGNTELSFQASKPDPAGAPLGFRLYVL